MEKAMRNRKQVPGALALASLLLSGCAAAAGAPATETPSQSPDSTAASTAPVSPAGTSSASAPAAGGPSEASKMICNDETKGDISKINGARCLYQLKRSLKMVQSGDIDAIVFAPLNKSSLKLAGMTEEDELRWFAKQLSYEGTTSEINIAGPLWTGRVTSHIALGQVAERINQKSVSKSIELLHKLR